MYLATPSCSSQTYHVNIIGLKPPTGIEADQLAMFKHFRGDELRRIYWETAPASWSKLDWNLRFRRLALTIWPCCLHNQYLPKNLITKKTNRLEDHELVSFVLMLHPLYPSNLISSQFPTYIKLPIFRCYPIQISAPISKRWYSPLFHVKY